MNGADKNELFTHSIQFYSEVKSLSLPGVALAKPGGERNKKNLLIFK